MTLKSAVPVALLLSLAPFLVPDPASSLVPRAVMVEETGWAT